MADRHFLWWRDYSSAVPGGRWDRYAAYNSKAEALTQALAIKAKDILQKLELTCPDSITDPEDKKIWEIKNKTMFDILLDELKPVIQQLVKSKINENQKNAAKLWQALEIEYRIHAADKRFELVWKFTAISMDMYDNNVQAYIVDFREICNKLKMMKFDIPEWQKNDRFIDGLRTHQQGFVWMKRRCEE